MYPKMKSKISDEKLGEFILSCVKLAAACRKVAKEMDELCKNTCAICKTRHEDIWTCETCGKRVCADHIVNIGNGPDDRKLVCIGCVEDQYDKA